MIEKMFNLNFNRQKICFVLLLLFNLCFMLCWCNQKQGWFLDEGFSYSQSNFISSKVIRKTIPDISADQTCRSYDEIKNFLTVQPDERFSYSKLQNNLIAHPPLFYLIFHTIHSFLPNVFSKWTGLIFNLLIFALTQIAFYALSRRFLPKSRALLPVVLYGFSVPAICTVTFIRGYMLLTLETTLLCFLALEILERQKENKPLKATLFAFCVTLFCGGITHYYFFISAFILCAGVCLILLTRRAYKNLAVYVGSTLFSVAMIPLLFPVVINHLFKYERGFSRSILPMINKNVAQGSFNLRVWNDFINKDFMAEILPYEFNWSLWFLLILAIGSAVYILIKRKINPEIILLSIVLIFSVLLISAVMPLEVKRYFFNIVPLFVLLIFMLIYQITNKIRFSIVLQSVLTVIIIVANLQHPQFQHYLYTSATKSGKFAQLLQNKTLYVKWVHGDRRWRMGMPALYSYSAADHVIFEDVSDDCYQNLMVDKSALKNAALMSAYIKETGCENFAGWQLFFTDEIACAYLPLEKGETDEK